MLGCLLSCSDPKEGTEATDSGNSVHASQRNVTIVVQPFEVIPESTIARVASRLKEIYSGDVVVNQPIEVPDEALNHNGSRYRADSLIGYLGKRVEGERIIIGLTDKDISTTKGHHKDFGVMGLGFCPGKSCVASTFRLKGKNREEELFNVAIHGLAHTQGFAQTPSRHCPDKAC